MVVRSDFTFDDEPTTVDDEPDSRAGRAVVAGVVALAIAVAIGVAVVTGSTPPPGNQAAPPSSVAIGRASAIGWQPLVPASGMTLPDVPSPMVVVTDRVCVGFERLDFDPDDRRPSIARCDVEPPGSLALNEIRSIVSIKAGFDTWHFVEAASSFDSVEVVLDDDETVSDDRVFLGGRVAALLLENGRDLARIEWSTRSATFRCTPEPTAWRSSVFCAERP